MSEEKTLYVKDSGLAADRLAHLLDALAGDAEYAPPSEGMTLDDLNREAASREMASVVTDLLGQTPDDVAAARLAMMTEEQRMRRDERISRTNDKRMWFGMFETAYRRMLKLRKTVSEGEGK